MKKRVIQERNVENVVQAMEAAVWLFTALKKHWASADGLQTWEGKEKDPFQRGLEAALLQARLGLSPYTASTAPAVLWSCGPSGHLLAAPTPQAAPVLEMGSPVPDKLYLPWAQKFFASLGEGTHLWEKGLITQGNKWDLWSHSLRREMQLVESSVEHIVLWLWHP